MSEKAEDLAYDRWPDVLIYAGIPDMHFNGKHGACPMCGGNDRFRWSKKHGGVWVCSNCTGGKYASPFRLLMEWQSFQNFIEAANFVRGFFGGMPNVQLVSRPSIQQQSQMDAEQYQRTLEKMQKLWGEAVEIAKNDPVDRYLQLRVPGVQVSTKNLRFHRAVQYWSPPEKDGDRPVLLGVFPAMLAKATDAHGNFVQLHKTYLTPDGRKADVPVAKKTERGVGVNSFAVRVSDVTGDTLGVAEGIESAFAASLIRNIPVWPCLNGPALQRFELPDELVGQVRRLIIFADHDEAKMQKKGTHGVYLRKPGTVYAEGLAHRARGMGLRPMVIMPATVGIDMADQWLNMVS